MADRADPLDERGLRLEQVERVTAVARDRHNDEGRGTQGIFGSARSGSVRGGGISEGARGLHLDVLFGAGGCVGASL